MTPNEIRDHMALVLVDIDEDELTDRFLDLLDDYARALRRVHDEKEVRRRVATMTLAVIRRLGTWETQTSIVIGRA